MLVRMIECLIYEAEKKEMWLLQVQKSFILNETPAPWR